MVAKWITADVFDGLATIEDGSVDLVITSPPFLALRSYLPADHPDKGKEIGSEATPAEFLDVMFRFTAELRRVLAPHGSICVELGDTYAGSGGGGGDYLEDGWREGQQNFAGSASASMRESNAAHWRQKNQNIEAWPLAKSKTLIPELYRIGLAYGINPLTGAESPAGKWRVRNVVTWARPNPPVGALGDKWRPATSDVVIACLSGKRFWDDITTRRPHKPASLVREGFEWRNAETESRHDDGKVRRKRSANNRGAPGNHTDGDDSEAVMNPSGAPLLDYWEIPLDGGEAKPYGPKESISQRTTNGPKSKAADRSEVQVGYDVRMESNQHGAPLLDYWEIPPTGYSGSHYAVFPPALVEPLVKAMCPQRVCRVCGEPSRRIVESERISTTGDPITIDMTGGDRSKGKRQNYSSRVHEFSETNFRFSHNERVDMGWTDCGHDDWRPGMVLDPFGGSGTTGLVATGHGHDCILVDLDSRNADLAEERIGPFLFERVDLLGNPV